MTFAITIGAFQLFNFVRLNVAWARRVFGEEAAICIYDSPSEENERIKALAEEYWCAYFCEPTNRGHFGGDIQASVAAIAFAQHHKRDIGIKLNQRTILLSPEIPQLLAEDFADPLTWLVTPDRYPAESILHESSKFHSRFEQSVDVLAFRVKEWNAQGVADRYRQQWTEGTGKFDTYSEVFWANESRRLGPAHRKPAWLTAHVPGEPFKYLRKIQNRESDYAKAAMDAGLAIGSFPTGEWSRLKPGEYRPSPRA